MWLFWLLYGLLWSPVLGWCLWVTFLSWSKVDSDSWSIEPLQWTWDDGAPEAADRSKINTEELYFPPGFLWGVATAAHQIEGNCNNSNWSEWEKKTRLWRGKSIPCIRDGQKVGTHVDHLNRVEEDIGLMTELGLNSYRFSIDWAKLEPSPGHFDKDFIEHYHREIALLKKAGIEPMITLHHFSHPIWFEEMGGFERADNLTYFENFCVRMFAEYSPQVKFFCTINEPSVYIQGSYVTGIFPPGKMDLNLAGEVMRNMMIGHVRVYYRLKQMENGSTAQIGIVHDTFQMHPWNKWNPLDVLGSKVLDFAFNKLLFNFFETGIFDYRLLGAKRIVFSEPKAKFSNDFIGLNYYSHYHVQFWPTEEAPLTLRHPSSSLMTDMPHPLYPEGLYCAIKQAARLGRPIYITENGIADGDDSRRHLYLKRYLYALSKAIKDGFDVRGYYYWTLYDNFEWAEGYNMRFGLYHVDFETQKRTLRDGSKYFQKVVQKFRVKELPDAKEKKDSQ
jgi:beta-glucosidase